MSSSTLGAREAHLLGRAVKPHMYACVSVRFSRVYGNVVGGGRGRGCADVSETENVTLINRGTVTIPTHFDQFRFNFLPHVDTDLMCDR